MSCQPCYPHQKKPCKIIVYSSDLILGGYIIYHLSSSPVYCSKQEFEMVFFVLNFCTVSHILTKSIQLQYMEYYIVVVSSSRCAYLSADEQVRDVGCILLQLRDPLLSHILEAGRIHHREANEEDVCHGVRQGSQAIIVLLSEQRTLGKHNYWAFFTVHQVSNGQTHQECTQMLLSETFTLVNYPNTSLLWIQRVFSSLQIITNSIHCCIESLSTNALQWNIINNHLSSNQKRCWPQWSSRD